MILRDYRIFFDMDGVLVDMVKGIQKTYPEWKEGDDLDWVDLYSKDPNLFLYLEPMPEVDKMLRAIGRTGAELFILTALPRRWSWPNATQHKHSCAYTLFPGYFWESNTLFGPFAEDKQWHCKGKKDVLIDDMPKNIEQWENQDGIGILHKSVDETLDALYDRCIAKEIGLFKDKQGVWRK